MKKVLFAASVAHHITAFHLPYLKWFKDNGYTVDVAAKNDIDIPFCDKLHNVEIQRNPFKKENIKAYKQLKQIIHNGDYDIIHCHTPVASIFTRLAAQKLRKKGTKVIYTAHGFHFFKGAPLINWLIYYPIEWLCSFMTDVLITINTEDYNFAKKHLHAKKIEYVPGVGIDTNKYLKNKTNSRQELLNISDDAVMLLSVGELNKNKNHEIILKAMQKINNSNIHYFVAGEGSNKQYLTELAKNLGLANRFHLLGYRNDIKDLLSCTDIFCFPSYREGLPVSVMEAMASGLPVVASNIRGNVDLIKNERNGFLVSPYDEQGFCNAINRIIDNYDLRTSMKENNISDIKKFDIQNVFVEMKRIYSRFMQEN